MKIGFIGLGRMGKAMILHLLEEGADVVVYNRTKQKLDEFSAEFQMKGKLLKAYQLDQLIKSLTPPRVIWLMVPHGKPVDETIGKLLEAGVTKSDIIIDGGNSFYKDSIRRYNKLKESGIHFMDAGTSGGLEGARVGVCLMVGGEEGIYKNIEPIFKILAGKTGHYAYFGSSGTGHFVKMVHNGVEYGMLESIGEGFEILAKGPFDINLHQVAVNWTHGSVVRGWLMELLARALKHDPKLEEIEGIVGGGETGSWAVDTAKEFHVCANVLEDALAARKTSLKNPTFAGKVIAALRREFGGHAITKSAKHSRAQKFSGTGYSSNR